jgi:hypothetical protein
MFLFSFYKGVIFHISVSSSAFQKKRRDQSVLLSLAIFQLFLVQNNQYVKAICFELECPEPLQSTSVYEQHGIKCVNSESDRS